MKEIPGIRPMRVGEVSRVVDRISFLYLERCIVHRDSNAVTVRDDRGVVHVPAAVVAAVMLGPGTTISHQAMMLLADSGVATVWVGERGVRYYAHGRPLARTSRLLLAQVEQVSNQNKRLAVARAMYGMRFAGEDVAGLTMQQLRGREGARVRRLYREHAKMAGVDWSTRDYRPDDFEASDAVNQALSAATTCLYGLVHAVVVALGCSPALGMVHTGHDRSFVYDVADLYKMEIAVPVAFKVAAGQTTDIGGDVRRAMRDAIYEQRLLERCVRDIHHLLGTQEQNEDFECDVVELWGPRESVVGGVNYADFDQEPPW
ncbi:MAG: type I-E CRISPR-associated endonuclease Cas1 [Micropruina sp.]|nr:type I-E CRISPR-associated endonuclease Cas1 [Micropruina sp.]